VIERGKRTAVQGWAIDEEKMDGWRAEQENIQQTTDKSSYKS